jgi:hypothetical protein
MAQEMRAVIIMFGYLQGQSYDGTYSLLQQSVRRQPTLHFFISSLERSFEAGVSRQHCRLLGQTYCEISCLSPWYWLVALPLEVMRHPPLSSFATSNLSMSTSSFHPQEAPQSHPYTIVEMVDTLLRTGDLEYVPPNHRADVIRLIDCWSSSLSLSSSD